MQALLHVGQGCLGLFDAAAQSAQQGKRAGFQKLRIFHRPGVGAAAKAQPSGVIALPFGKAGRGEAVVPQLLGSKGVYHRRKGCRGITRVRVEALGQQLHAGRLLPQQLLRQGVEGRLIGIAQ